MKISDLHFPPPLGASALALVFREFENTDLESAFLLLVQRHTWTQQKLPEFRDIRKVDSFLCIEISGFQGPIGRCVYDQTF